MKIFCSIMAIIILALSCIPCSDAESFAIVDTKISTSSSNTEHSHSSNQEHKDLCSPFCQCSCCAIAFTLPSNAVSEIALRSELFDKAFACHALQYPAGIALPVWQPPQLV